MFRQTGHGMFFAVTAFSAVFAVGSQASARSDIIADVLVAGDRVKGKARIVMAASGDHQGKAPDRSTSPETNSDVDTEASAGHQVSTSAQGIRAPNKPAVSDARMEALQPYQLIRSLQFVQDSVVMGDHSAMEMQRFLLGVVDERLRNADQSVFDNPRNVDAALIYAMSGGNPATLDLLALQDRFGNFDNEITTVLRAYLDGRAARTKTSLEDILKAYRNSDISPYLALVAANVKAGLNEEGSLALFDWARLGAPGTILEEAALRRSLAIATKKGLLDKAVNYAEIYARRFISSPYAGQFADQLVDLAIEHFEFLGADRLISVLASMDRPRRREVYLRIARKAAIAGHRELALLASDNAKALSSDDDLAPAALAGLYSSLANVSSAEVSEIDEALAKLENMPLSARDAALRKAARLIANEIVREPDPNSLTQAFSPKIKPEIGDRQNSGFAKQALNQPDTVSGSPETPTTVSASGNETEPALEPDPELARADIEVDPEFRAYLDGQSKLISDIDQLLAGEDGVETK